MYCDFAPEDLDLIQLGRVQAAGNAPQRPTPATARHSALPPHCGESAHHSITTRVRRCGRALAKWSSASHTFLSTRRSVCRLAVLPVRSRRRACTRLSGRGDGSTSGTDLLGCWRRQYRRSVSRWPRLLSSTACARRRNGAAESCDALMGG